jgi:hypothetical protein
MGAASFGIAAISPLGAAFAQDGGTTTTVPEPAPTTPATPATPDPATPAPTNPRGQHTQGEEGCPNMGGTDSGFGSETPATPSTANTTNVAHRVRASRL